MHLLRAYIERAASTTATMARYAWRRELGGLRDGIVTMRALGREVAGRIRGANATRLCPVCGWSGREFAPRYYVGNFREGIRCFGCGCTDRCRLVKLLVDGPMSSLFAGGRTRVLDVGPVRYSRRFFPDDCDYVSFDLYADIAMVRGDLCAAPFRDASFDFFLCFHVLDHIDDDAAAMRELLRILRPGGVGLLDHTTDWGAPTREFRGSTRLAGVGPVVRRYGADIADRLREVGFDVEIVDADEALDEATRTRHGIFSRRVLVCRRP